MCVFTVNDPLSWSLPVLKTARHGDRGQTSASRERA